MFTLAVPVPMNRGAPVALVAFCVGIRGSRLRTTGSVTAARWASLYRLAYLLAASPTGAEDLLQTTLEKAYMNWSRIGRMEHGEAYVRRMLAQAPSASART